MCQDYLGAFENNLVQLTAVSVKLNRRIELNTRNKDAVSPSLLSLNKLLIMICTDLCCVDNERQSHRYLPK
jgi:hypothetical protein